MMLAMVMESGMRQDAGTRRGGGVNGGWSAAFGGYSPEQLFTLAADLESYPRFVPWCIATRILERGTDHWLCDNVFGKGPIRLRFRTHARFDPPRAITITSDDGPFQEFELRWRFQPAGDGCRVDVGFAMHFRSDLVGLIARISTPEAERRVVAAFRRRAERLYGPAA